MKRRQRSTEPKSTGERDSSEIHFNRVCRQFRSACRQQRLHGHTGEHATVHTGAAGVGEFAENSVETISQ